MPNPGHTGRLSLAPGDVRSAPDYSTVLGYLCGGGFIGQALGDGRYRVGEEFLRLISFMGCSPHIELDAQDPDASFCHVRLQGPLEDPVLLLGRNAQAPRCKACRGRMDDWREHSAAWPHQARQPCAVCPRCGAEQCPIDLNWRRSAGAGRLFVHVEDVFPGEAVPVPGLLKGLEQVTGTPWDYFFVQD